MLPGSHCNCGAALLPPLLPSPSLPSSLLALPSMSTSSSSPSPTIITKSTNPTIRTPSVATSTSSSSSSSYLVSSYFISGAVAGAASRTSVAPLERIKILQQCQGNNRAYTGVWASLKKIWLEEGVKGMFRGNGINCLRIMPYSAVQFVSKGERARCAIARRASHRRASYMTLISLSCSSLRFPSCTRATRPLAPLLDLLRTIQKTLHRRWPETARYSSQAHCRCTRWNMFGRLHLPARPRP